MTTPTKYQVFDADARASDREKAGLRLGGKDYPRRRRNNKVQRTIRRLGREQQGLLDKLDEARKTNEIDALVAKITETKEPTKVKLIDAELRNLRDSIDLDSVDDLQEQFELTLFRLLAALLGPAEDGDELTAERLADALDIEDAGALSRQLMGATDDEPAAEAGDEPDPT